LALLRHSLDVLDNDIRDRINTTKLVKDPKLELPSSLRGRWDPTPSPIHSVLTIRSLSETTTPSHIPSNLNNVLYPSHRIGLDVQKRMGFGFDRESLLLRSWVNSDCDGLHISSRRFYVKTNAKNPKMPERSCLPGLNHLPRPLFRAWHQRILVIIDYRNHDEKCLRILYVYILDPEERRN
jgi:hypothetical protein